MVINGSFTHNNKQNNNNKFLSILLVQSRFFGEETHVRGRALGVGSFILRTVSYGLSVEKKIEK